jgi:hypothetical protein
MNNNNQNYFSPIMAALIGGIAGALVVYFSDEKRRKYLLDKVEEGKENGYEFKDKIDKSIKSGRKILAKKIRQVEDRVAQT